MRKSKNSSQTLGRTLTKSCFAIGQPLMRSVRHCAQLFTISIALLCGCNRASDQASIERGAEDISSAPRSTSGPKKEAPLELVSCELWDQRLASQLGKIVVVDTWATWCLPCMEEFPKLVALHQKYSDDGVVCMSVSVDELEQRASVQDFLNRHGADFANYLIADDSNAWWDKWEIKGIPIVLVFDAQGKLARKFDRDDPDNQFTYADVEKFVVELQERDEMDISGQ
jgi:thiol-disulfide isomerase/thioredoxin